MAVDDGRRARALMARGLPLSTAPRNGRPPKYQSSMREKEMIRAIVQNTLSYAYRIECDHPTRKQERCTVQGPEFYESRADCERHAAAHHTQLVKERRNPGLPQIRERL